MYRTLLFSLALGFGLIVPDLSAQDRGDDRGPGRGRFGAPPEFTRGGDRRAGSRPSFMQFLPVLAVLDTDKNGEISGEEMANATAALKTLDRNKDGKLTEDEIRPERPPGERSRGGFGVDDRRRGGFGRPNPERGGFTDRGGQDREAMGRPNAAETAERMMAFDKNKDGQLTPDELSERMHPLLKEADTNGDGAASREEIIKLAEKRAGGARGANQRGGTQATRRPRLEK